MLFGSLNPGFWCVINYSSVPLIGSWYQMDTADLISRIDQLELGPRLPTNPEKRADFLILGFILQGERWIMAEEGRHEL